MASKRVGHQKCWHCGARGHQQSECEALRADGGSKQCFVCRSTSHLAADCPEASEAKKPATATPQVNRVIGGSSSRGSCCSRMSVLITTSPVPSNPSTMMLEAVLGTFSRVAGLAECPLVIVCDGFKSAPKSTWKAGRITEDAAVRYEEYVRNLEGLLSSDRLPPGTQLVILQGRNGQAMAVQAGLSYVKTPFVCVHQHDLEFMFDFDLTKVLDVLEDESNDVKYVGMPLLTNLAYEACAWQHHGVRVKAVEVGGLDLVPVIFWYDSTHITSVRHYKNLVFGPAQVYRLGNFVEETFGVQQRLDIMTKGMPAHTKYGTYHCISHSIDGTRRPLICHLNGVRFLTPEQRAERGFPANPPVEFYPSRVMMSKRQRRLRMILDTIVSFAGVDLQQDVDVQQIKDLLGKEINETRIRSSAPAAELLKTATLRT